jgi:predicted transcriptional regulator
MVDIDTHRIIDLIQSRDYDDVKNWLASYPNIKVVSRDGSLTYKNAITSAHPGAIQVNDRFHILKNLTSYCKDFLKKIFTPKIIIETIPVKTVEKLTSKTIDNRKITLKEKMKKAEELFKKSLNKSSICRELNIDIRVLNKLLNMTESERYKYFKTVSELKQEAKAAKKMELVLIVRAMSTAKTSNRKIAEELNISRKTVKTYLNPEFSPVHGRKDIKTKSILDPFKTVINEMFIEGKTAIQILEAIRIEDYKGSDSLLRHYLAYKKKEYCKLDIKELYGATRSDFFRTCHWI